MHLYCALLLLFASQFRKTSSTTFDIGSDYLKKCQLTEANATLPTIFYISMARHIIDNNSLSRIDTNNYTNYASYSRQYLSKKLVRDLLRILPIQLSKFVADFPCKIAGIFYRCIEQFQIARVLDFDIGMSQVANQGIHKYIHMYCHKFPRHSSFEQSYKLFFISRIIFEGWPSNEIPQIGGDCLQIMKFFTGPLLVSLFTNEAVRPQVFAFVVKTTERIAKSDTYSAMEALTRFEYVGLKMAAEYCDNIRQQHDTIYSTLSKFFAYVNILRRYFVPCSLIVGTVCNILYVIINYRLWKTFSMTNYLELAMLGVVDLCIIYVNLMPYIASELINAFQKVTSCNRTRESLNGSISAVEPPSFRLIVSCPWTTYVSLTLRSISNWGLASMELYQIFCIKSNKSKIRRICCGSECNPALKYVLLVVLCALFNGPVLITDKLLNHGNFYVACWRLKTFGVLPFVQDAYFFVIVTALPFLVTFVKNVTFIRHQKIILCNSNKQLMNVIIVQCARFLIFSTPALLSFLLHSMFPLHYLFSQKKMHSLSKGIVFANTYLPTVAKCCISLNHYSNLICALSTSSLYRKALRSLSSL